MTNKIDNSGLDGLGKTAAELTAENPESKILYAFRQMDSEDLARILDGEFDLEEIASAEMMNRGCDSGGKWCGFPKAEELHVDRINARNEYLRDLYAAQIDLDLLEKEARENADLIID